MTAVELDREELRAALFGLSTLVRERSIAGRGCPTEVVALRDRLEAEWRHPSPTRQQRQAALEESDVCVTRVGTAAAAQMLGWSTRRVQRNADLLGGQMIAGRLVFRERDVADYAATKHIDMQGDSIHE